MAVEPHAKLVSCDSNKQSLFCLMHKTTKLSIIIPVVTIENIVDDLKRLVHQISSLEKLADGLIQTIFVDNSPGFSLDHLLRRIVHNRLDNWLVVKSSPNCVSKARNTGIKQATGEFLAFVDADDGIDADAYLSVLNLIYSCRDEVDIVFMQYDAVISPLSLNTIQERKVHTPLRLETVDSCHISDYALKYIYSPRSQNPLTHCWSSLFRRSVINETKLVFNSKYNQLEDISFVAQMLSASKKVYVCNVIAYHHNLYHNNRLSRQFFFPDDIFDFVSKQTKSVIPLLSIEFECHIEHLFYTMISNHLFMYYVRALSRSSVFNSHVTKQFYNQSLPIEQICDYYTPGIGESKILPRLLSRRLPHSIIRTAWWFRSIML